MLPDELFPHPFLSLLWPLSVLQKCVFWSWSEQQACPIEGGHRDGGAGLGAILDPLLAGGGTHTVIWCAAGPFFMMCEKLTLFALYALGILDLPSLSLPVSIFAMGATAYFSGPRRKRDHTL